MVNYTEPQLEQNLAAAELAGCVLIRQKDAALFILIIIRLVSGDIFTSASGQPQLTWI